MNKKKIKKILNEYKRLLFFMFFLVVASTFTVSINPVLPDYDDPPKPEEKQPVKSCPEKIFVTVNVVDKKGSHTEYTFHITDKESYDAIQHAIMEYEETMDLIATMRTNNERKESKKN